MPEPRVVTVPPERLERWLAEFARRHPGTVRDGSANGLVLRADDGAEALVRLPVGGTVADAVRPRTLGALLVRRGGHAVGVFVGRDLVASKVGSAYVQGRTKAGGWSQQRYARRRDHQADAAYGAAADAAVRVLGGRTDLEAVVLGGDRAGLRQVLADPRLRSLAGRVSERVYPVPDPRLAVLRAFPDQFLAVEIRLNAEAQGG